MELSLDALQDEAMKKLLKFDKYTFIIKNIYKCKDITKDIKLQRYFNDFYAINAAKKNAKWKENYYECFQEMLEKKQNNQEIKFIDILYKISFDGKIEASFASKMLATINPNMPVWDINVIKNLKKELLLDGSVNKVIKINFNSYTILGNTLEEKINNANLIYKSLIKIEENIIKNQKDIIIEFRNRYTKLIKECELSDMKILDFFLWMKRD